MERICNDGKQKEQNLGAYESSLINNRVKEYVDTNRNFYPELTNKFLR